MQTTEIPQDQIEIKKKIGKAKGKDLWYVKARGGYHVVHKSDGEIIGAGNHPAVARYIAEQHEPDLMWTELSKSDHYAYEDFAHLVPEAVELTGAFRKAQGK